MITTSIKLILLLSLRFMEHDLYIIKEMLFRVFVMFIIVEYYKIKAQHVENTKLEKEEEEIQCVYF